MTKHPDTSEQPADTPPPAHASLTEAMIAAQQSFDTVRKQATNPHFKSKYADLATVIDAVSPGLLANGILLTQMVVRDEGDLVLRTSLRHAASDQEMLSEVPLPPPADWQKWGSALTYARRYTIMALTGVAPEDDDGNSAEGARPSTAKGDRFYREKPRERGQVEDPGRKAELAKQARHDVDREAAKEDSATPAPERPKRTARQWFTQIDREMADHGGDPENVGRVYQGYADVIDKLPDSAKGDLALARDEYIAAIEQAA